MRGRHREGRRSGNSCSNKRLKRLYSREHGTDHQHTREVKTSKTWEDSRKVEHEERKSKEQHRVHEPGLLSTRTEGP